MMYIPSAFRVSDRAVVASFMREFDFATVVTPSPGGTAVTHIPVIIEELEGGIVISGHVARGNAHWQLMDGDVETLAIFHGPHGYVSPTWYTDRQNVPTWNYAVVHAYGPARFVEDAAFVERSVEQLSRRYEAHRPSGWSPEELSTAARSGLLKGIVGFVMPVTRFDAKFKLGQNRTADDRRGAVSGLEREGTAGAAALAAFMKRFAGA